MKTEMETGKRLDELPDFFSTLEFSQVFRVSKATAYRMAAQGAIPCLRIGRRVIFSREHTKRWVEQAMEGK